MLGLYLLLIFPWLNLPTAFFHGTQLPEKRSFGTQYTTADFFIPIPLLPPNYRYAREKFASFIQPNVLVALTIFMITIPTRKLGEVNRRLVHRQSFYTILDTYNLIDVIWETSNDNYNIMLHQNKYVCYSLYIYHTYEWTSGIRE